jgi:hypothetical protein
MSAETAGASGDPAPPRFIDRGEFVADVRLAVLDRHGYAAGKLGTSEKYWMYYEVLLATEPARRRRMAYEASLKFHCLLQSGIFPTDLEFLRAFNRTYVDAVRQLDCVGVIGDRPDLEEGVIRHYGLSNRLTPYVNQEPDRSTPARDAECYLPSFRDRKLLIVCPFAGILQQRATADLFEKVWAKTGKRWFAPASVDALEFPYGFDRDTHNRFGTVLNLHDHIAGELARRDFDVALIAAGGLGIPLAATVKRLGKVGISLGGHLQILFGVLGKRWRDREDWRDAYFTDAWIDMPAHYRPRVMVVDDGAYW